MSLVYRPRVSALLATRWLVLCGVVMLAGGCGPTAKNIDEPISEEITIKKVSAENLPPLAAYLPLLDDDKIAIAPPEGWTTLRFEAKHLARFVKEDQFGLPRILITVDAADDDDLETVSEENVIEFAEQVAQRLKDRKAAQLEPARPMMIGEQAFVRYVLRSKFREGNIERQVLQTIVARRLYNIDLQVEEDDLLSHRDAAYAVAAGLKFHPGKPGAAPTEPAPVKPPAKE